MSDLISRQEAIDALLWADPNEIYIHYEIAVNTIKRIPAVMPERGEWEIYEDQDGIYGICSKCGIDTDFSHYGEAYKFCPHCGARMEGDGR